MTAAITPLNTMDDIVLGGVRLTDQVGKNQLGDSGLIRCTFDADAGMSTQIQFSYLDPGFQVTRGKVRFTMGTKASFNGYLFQVSKVEVAEEQGNPVIHVSLRSDLVRLLKERQGRKVMENVSPTTFIATELKAVGATGVLQASAKRTTVSRDVKEKGETEGMDPAAADNEMSSWSTFRRFAQETGYLLFEDSGVLYFGQPQWLVQRDSRPLTVAYGDSAFRNASSPKTMPYEVPACSTSIDSKITEVTVKIEPKWFSQVRVGQALTLRGVPGFAATYLITAVKYDMIGTSVIEVTAQTPINQVPEKGPFADGGRLV